MSGVVNRRQTSAKVPARFHNGERQPVLPNDVPALRADVGKGAIDLIVVDPLSSYLAGNVDR